MPETHPVLHAVTNIGDGSVVSAITASVCLYLLACSRRREAAALATSYAIAAVIIVVLKLLLFGCSNHDYLPDLRSPSGHAALSVAVYGMLAFLMSREVRKPIRVLIMVLAASLLSGIIVTRVVLGYHSVIEVISGSVVGLISLKFTFEKIIENHYLGRINIIPLIMIFLLFCLLLSKTKLPSENMLNEFSAYIQPYFPCRFVALKP